jgi:uncharacterized phage protein (TIGR01671 family)
MTSYNYSTSLKFRAYSKRWGMIYPDNKEKTISIGNNDIHTVWHDSACEECVPVMLSIGKPDMKNKDIYYGDIIRIHIKEFTDQFGIKSDFVIEPSTDTHGLTTFWRHIENSGYECSTHIMRDEEQEGGCNYEVIGNIYENPNLLRIRKNKKHNESIPS